MLTTAVATKRALYDALTALTAEGQSLEGVAVTWGFPVQAQPREWIYLGDITTNQQALLIGQQKRDEEYTIEVLVHVVDSVREDQQYTTERALAIAEVIGSVVRPHDADPLDVPGLIWIGVTKTDVEEAYTAEQRVALITINLSCKARV